MQGRALQSISHWGSKFPKLGTKSKVRMKTVHKKKEKFKKNKNLKEWRAKLVLLPEIGSQMSFTPSFGICITCKPSLTHSPDPFSS
jgi:hypothetical protein